MSVKHKLLTISVYLLVIAIGFLGASRISWFYLIGSKPVHGCPVART